MNKWYEIKAAPRAADQPPSAEIFVYGDIGESWDGESVTAASFVKDVAALDADTITVRLNSYGGSVSDGVAIYNAIKRHKASVTVAIDGVAVSIASLIAMAGDRIEMAENALMMIHAPWGGAVGNSADMRDMADILDKYAQAMATSYVAKSGKTPDEIMALLSDGADHWFTAAEAQAAGFADAITPALAIAASFDRAAFAARHQRTTPAAAAAPTPEKEITMTVKDAITAAADQLPAAPAINVDEVRAAAIAAEAGRRNDIKAAFSKFAARPGVADVLAACENDTACTVQAAREKLLEHIGKDVTPVAGQHVVTIEDEADKFKAAATQAILVRAGVQKADDIKANPLRGHKLLDIARAALDRAGVNTRGMSQMDVVASAFTQSTSDFPILLENTMHKALQTAYAKAALTWNRFCKTGTVSDFRAHNRYRTGSFGNLDSINELGEFKNKSIPDGEKSSISVATKGNTINMSRQMVINDDLGAFVGLAADLGWAAARSIETDVYAFLALNSGLGPVMADAKTLFHADHGNLTATAAITMVAIDADRVAMGLQKDISGNDYLDLRPTILLLSTALGGTARSINGAAYDPDTANKLQKPNIVNGLFSDIVDTPRITGTRRYLFADPSTAPVLEVAFLDGNQTPYLEQQAGFDVDGTRYKVRLDYGIAAIDYRGAITNAG